MHVVIIGLGTGGFFAAKQALRNRDAKVTVIEQRAYDMFSPCGLPFALEGVAQFEKLKHEVPAFGRLRKLLNHRAVSIDTKSAVVKAQNLSNGITKEVKYDSLILATGGTPIILPVPGAKELLGKGVFTISTIEDTIKLMECAKEKNHAVVVGGGAIGLETASALRNLGLKVAIIECTPSPFPRNLDPDMGELITSHLKKHFGVKFGEGIDAIKGGDWVEEVVIRGERIPTELVLMAVGREPNREVAKKAGIKTGRYSICTNEKMETNVANVYAIGDCAQSFHGVTRKPPAARLATTAYQQALIAGVNATGGNATYTGSLDTFACVVDKLEIASTGLTSKRAIDEGYKAISAKTKGRNKPAYMPNSQELAVKLITEEKGKLIGAQAIGEGAKERINLLSLTIRAGLSVEELSRAELAYSPPLSELYDVIYACTDILSKKLSKL